MVAVGIAGSVVSWASAAPKARVVGGNLPVNEAGPLDVSANNSPSLVASPNNAANLAVAARVDAPSSSCGLYRSADGGATWSKAPTPPPSEDIACFAPDVSFGPDGTLYFSYTSFGPVEGQGRVPDALWVAASADGGKTLASPTKAAGRLAFHARVLADPVTPKRVYLAWVQAAGAAGFGFTTVQNPIVVSRSDDGGATWGPAVRITPPDRARVVAPSMAATPGGQLYVAYLDVGNDALDYSGAHEGNAGEPYPERWQLVLARSSDGGTSWSESVIDEIVPTQRFLALLPPVPSITVDERRGRVYAGFQDGRSGDADVRVWASDDGVAWGPPRRVNDTRVGDGTSQYLPQLDVAPGGRLDVVYYDRRADPGDIMNEVSFQSSSDGGRTFTRRLRLSDRNFDSRIGLNADRGLAELGSRLGLLATDSGALALWADTRAGIKATGRQDLARAVVSMPPNSPLGSALRLGGAGVALLGLVLVVLALRRRRHGGPGDPGREA